MALRKVPFRTELQIGKAPYSSRIKLGTLDQGLSGRTFDNSFEVRNDVLDGDTILALNQTARIVPSRYVMEPDIVR